MEEGSVFGIRASVSSTTRAMAQLASTNLLGSEQFSIGGVSSVRGYRERIYSGDTGMMFTEELQHRGPSIPLGKRLPALDTAGVAFWDYGRTVMKWPTPVQAKANRLAGAGVGIRLSAGNSFSASLDYATPLLSAPGEKGRVHFRVSLSY